MEQLGNLLFVFFYILRYLSSDLKQSVSLPGFIPLSDVHLLQLIGDSYQSNPVLNLYIATVQLFKHLPSLLSKIFSYVLKSAFPFLSFFLTPKLALSNLLVKYLPW